MSDATTEAALREMSRSIGGLESTVKSLVETWTRQEQAASQGRRDLHQKFDGVAKDVAGLKGEVEAVVKDLADIAPSVKAFEVAKERAVGAQTVGKVIWGGLLGAGGLLGWALANWITIGPKGLH